MGLLIGVDDAGRGPVIGPMMLAGILIEEPEEQKLKSLGAKDSKQLTPKKRRMIRDQLIKQYPYHLEISTPEDIDASENLNYLEAIKTAMIINKLAEGKGPIKALVDCPSTNIQSWSNDVKKLLKQPELIDLHCEHRADANHAVVGAASIIAKEAREEAIEDLRKEYHTDFGSGYPSDPKTVAFITQHAHNPTYKKIIRYSWKTVENLTGKKKQTTLF